MNLTPGRNVWCTAKAERAAILVDAAAYFGAVRAAMIQARRSILVAGWDIHSQTRLTGGDGAPDDGYPEQFAEFLGALAQERPELDIRLLLWDFSVVYAAERDPFPTLTLRWNTPRGIRLCMDDCVPLGSSQHQKLVVVDDALAFSGGIDMTIRRWDTSAHSIDEPRRVDPAGKPYRPFHDVQMMVDGEAARALGDLVRARWENAACETLAPAECGNDPWPAQVAPDFEHVTVGIARTQPRYEDEPEHYEVEQLFLDSIDAAERSIYIENQFLTAPRIAERLAQRLAERPELEVLIVTLDSHDSWLEAHSMLAGRVRFTQTLKRAGGDRVLVAHPQVADGGRSVATMVHAKVMIVDDAILRVGSANLNNRSMGADTECDLVIVAGSDNERRRIAHTRARLIGDHCGVTADEACAAIEQAGGSLIAAARALRRDGHSLEPIVDDPERAGELPAVFENIADPERPVGAESFLTRAFGGYLPARHIGTMTKVVAAGLLVLGVALAWQFVPLADPNTVKAAFAAIAQSHAAPVLVVGAFLAGGLVSFPVTVLIGATAAVFGPVTGFCYATAGSLASALATYAVGAALGKRTLLDLLGPTLNRLRQRVARRGVVTVAAVRLVPIAPFTVVNLVAGASGIPVLAYAAGTLIGMLPGLIMISAVGHQLARVFTSPSTSDLALLALFVAGWVALSLAVQAAVSRYWRMRP
ncbi:MAG: VTT domain-containing protein [Pseudolabrys sp.]